VNSIVKGGYLDNSKSVHEFTKRFLDALDHIHDNEARENTTHRCGLLYIPVQFLDQMTECLT
jgi:hypothetical protein